MALQQEEDNWFNQDPLEEALGRVHPEIAHRIDRFERNFATKETIYLTMLDLRDAYIELNDWLQMNMSNADAVIINEKKLKPSYLLQKKQFQEAAEV